MIYTHQFVVRAPLAEVLDFHRRSDSMAAITPPPIRVKMNRAPSILASGDRMDFTMWLGPLPVRWIARIEGADGPGFIDRQIQGPFDAWVHRHIFVPLDHDATAIYDEVRVAFHSTDRLWHLIGLGMWLGLPFLFAYRKWRTRRLLERRRHVAVRDDMQSA